MNEELNNEFPWLIFSIQKEQFAINSKHVAAIVHKNEEVVFVPHEHDYVKGLITFRGTPIKLIDTRRLLNEESIEVEVAAFNDMIDQRKADHIKWVNELERCSHAGEQFGLATDPHKCAFGKWYDKFETDILTIKFHMKKIEEPHRLLHGSAAEYNACPKDCENCERAECLKVIVERAKTEYVTEVLEILEEAKNVFEDYFKEMIIAVEAGEDTFGFLVDEVIAVEDIDIMRDFSESRAIFRSKFFNGVAKRQNYDKLILLMNVEEMLNLQRDIEITHKHLLSLSGEVVSEDGNGNDTDEVAEQSEMPEDSDIDIIEEDNDVYVDTDELLPKNEMSEFESEDIDIEQQEDELDVDVERIDADAQNEPASDIEEIEGEVASQVIGEVIDDDFCEDDISQEELLSLEEQNSEASEVLEDNVDLEMAIESDVPSQDDQDDIEIKE